MNYRKTNNPSFVKDRKTGFVLNINEKELQTYRAELNRIKKMRNLEEDLGAMKALLAKLLTEYKS